MADKWLYLYPTWKCIAKNMFPFNENFHSHLFQLEHSWKMWCFWINVLIKMSILVLKVSCTAPDQKNEVLLKIMSASTVVVHERQINTDSHWILNNKMTQKKEWNSEVSCCILLNAAHWIRWMLPYFDFIWPVMPMRNIKLPICFHSINLLLPAITPTGYLPHPPHVTGSHRFKKSF